MSTFLYFCLTLLNCNNCDTEVIHSPFFSYQEGTIKLIAAFGQQDPGDGVLSLYDIHQHENKCKT